MIIKDCNVDAICRTTQSIIEHLTTERTFQRHIQKRYEQILKYEGVDQL
jgi:hypothetical protein